MSSFKNFEVLRRLDGTDAWGVYPSGQLNNWIASFKSEKHAQRLCEMLNDTNFTKVGAGYEFSSDADNKRTAQVTKLFCLQENLTWADLGLEERHIRLVNRFLEMPLDLRQAS